MGLSAPQDCLGPRAGARRAEEHCPGCELPGEVTHHTLWAGNHITHHSEMNVMVEESAHLRNCWLNPGGERVAQSCYCRIHRGSDSRPSPRPVGDKTPLGQKTEQARKSHTGEPKGCCISVSGQGERPSPVPCDS